MYNRALSPHSTLHLHDLFYHWKFVLINPLHPFFFTPCSFHLWQPPFCFQLSMSLVFVRFRFYIYMKHTVFFFSIWLILLSIMPSSFFHVIANGDVFLFFMNGWHLILYLYHNFICLSIYGHLGCFNVSAIANTAAINRRHICLFELIFCFLWIYSQNSNCWIMWRSNFNFLRTLYVCVF